VVQTFSETLQVT